MILIIDYNDIDYDDGDDDKVPGGEQKRAGRARPTIIIHSLHNPPTIIELMMIVEELLQWKYALHKPPTINKLMMIVKELFQWKYASGNDIMWLEGNVFVAFQVKGGDYDGCQDDVTFVSDDDDLQ